MNRTSLLVALLATGIAFVTDGQGATATSTVTAVTLPSNVVADRANVSADFAAVATAKAKLVADVAAGNTGAVVADSAAFEAARIKLDTDMQTLRIDAQTIVRQDESNLNDDRIMLELYSLTNNAAAYATAQAQFNADRAQAEANREAIFGNLCPEGVICAEGPGFGAGPCHGPRPGPNGAWRER